MRYDPLIRLLARVSVHQSPKMSAFLEHAKTAFSSDRDPDVVPENQVTLATGAVTAVFTARNRERTWHATVGGSTVDLVHMAGPDGQWTESAEFVKRAALFFHDVLASSQLNASRVAFVREGLVSDLGVPRMNAVAHRLLRFPATFEPIPFEWDWRCATRIEREFGDVKETTNTIATVKRVSGRFASGVAFDRLRLDTDVNTPPENPEARLTPENVQAFFVASDRWHVILTDALVAHMGIEP